MDVSVSRFKDRSNVETFQQLKLPFDRLSHYGTLMRFYGVPLPLNASFLSANAPVWRDVEAEFAEAASRAKGMAYGHDEETILADCLWRRPELFHSIGSPDAVVPQSNVKRILKAVRQRIGYGRSSGT